MLVLIRFWAKRDLFSTFFVPFLFLKRGEDSTEDASSGHRSEKSLVMFFSIRDSLRPLRCTLCCMVFVEGDLSEIFDLGDLTDALLGV